MSAGVAKNINGAVRSNGTKPASGTKPVPKTVPASGPVPSNGTAKLPNDGTGVLQLDPWLEPFKDNLRSRYSKAQEWIQTLEKHEGGLEKFSRVCLTRW